MKGAGRRAAAEYRSVIAYMNTRYTGNKPSGDTDGG